MAGLRTVVRRGEALGLIPSWVSSWDCSMKLGTRVVMWWTSIIALEPRSTFSLVLCTVSPDTNTAEDMELTEVPSA